MRVVSSEAIILKHQDYRERDRLVTFLARDKGRMAGVARGARNPKGRGISAYEPFTRGVIHYVEPTRSELVTIRKCDPQPPFLFLQKDYDKFLFAAYFAELINLCPIHPGEAEPFFDLLAGALARLYEEKNPRALHLLRLDFELAFFDCLGVQPQWSRCGACGRPLGGNGKGNPPAPGGSPPPGQEDAPGGEPELRPTQAGSGAAQFDAALGGLRCGTCRRAGTGLPDLAPGSLAFLRAWRAPNRPPGLQPTRANLVQLEAALTRHLIHQLEREPRSLALLPKPGG